MTTSFDNREDHQTQETHDQETNKEADISVTPIEQNLQEAEISMDGLLAEQDNLRNKLYNREIVKLKVIQVTSEYIFVDIGEKKEGIISVKEFDGKKPPNPGDKIIAVIKRKGNEDRHTVLSHAKALETIGWDYCKKSFDENARTRGVITELVKGGYRVDVHGVNGFMPLSHSELHPAYKHHLPANAKIRCQILEMDPVKGKLIVSRKKVLQEDESVRKDKVLGEIKPGNVLRVVVSRVKKDAIFLRYHGIEGIVKIVDIAWRDPDKAIKTYKRGQRIKAKLLILDKENGNLEFGIKQLFPNPADVLKRRFPFKSVVKGKIVQVDEEIVKVEIGPDVFGTIPVFEMPEAKDKIGESVTALMMGVNAGTYELRLSIKKYDDYQNRKIMSKYLKKEPPKMTLGQMLSDAVQNNDDNQ
jgi:small subunit ribosomal protein S1